MLYLKCTWIDHFLIIPKFETKECFETVVYLSEVVMEKMIGNRRKSIVDVGLFELCYLTVVNLGHNKPAICLSFLFQNIWGDTKHGAAWGQLYNYQHSVQNKWYWPHWC